jgi:hypothetical protein
MAFLLGLLGVGALLNEIIPDKPPWIVAKIMNAPQEIRDSFHQAVNPPPSLDSYYASRDVIKAKYQRKPSTLQ